ncbi:MAG: GAF domain-containing protein [Pseudonocardiales bacterium]
MAQREESLVQWGQRWFAARSLWTGGGAALATPVVTTIIPAIQGWMHVGVAALVGALALVGFAVPAAREAAAERRAQLAEDRLLTADVALKLTVSDALLPVLTCVVNGIDPASSTPNEVAAAETLRMVLGTAAHLCGGGRGRVRACWYEIRGLTSSNPGLYPAAHIGRGVKPSTEFPRAEPRGQALFDLLTNDKAELIDDLNVEKPINWKATTNGRTSYRTFLTVPVRTNDQLFGILTVDADQPGVFTEADVDLARLLGVTLALALSQQTQPAVSVAGPSARTSS